MIEFVCPHCNKSLRVKSEVAGKKGKCPGCSQMIQVPVQVEEVVVDPLDQLASSTVGPRPHPTPPPPKPRHVSHKAARAKTPDAPKGTNGLGIAALVLGIIAALTCWIPFIGLLSMPLAILGLLFGIIGLLISLIGRKSGVGLPVSGSIVCVVALFVAIASTGTAAEAIDQALEEAKQASAESTERRGTRFSSSSSDSESGSGATSSGRTPSRRPPERPTIMVDYIDQTDEDFGTRLTFRLTNNTDKPISSLKGAIHLYDQFDDHLEGLSVKVDDPIGPGESIEESGMWPMVGNRTLKLLEQSPNQVKLKFKVEKVNYSSGRAVSASSGAETTAGAKDPITITYIAQKKGDFGTTLVFSLTNNTGKAISALKGGLHIYDQFGDHLEGLAMKIDSPIAPGKSVNEEGMWPTVGSRTLQLLAETPSRVRLEFRPEQIHFADVTVTNGR